MSGSTVPTVRAALVAKFAELLNAAGDTTDVLYGHPGQDIPDRFVAVSSTDAGMDREQRTLPLRVNSSRTETYGLSVIFWVLVGDHEQVAQRTVVEACWATFDILDTGLRAETTVGGVVSSALFTKAVDDDYLLNEGRAAQIVATCSINVNRA